MPAPSGSSRFSGIRYTSAPCLIGDDRDRDTEESKWNGAWLLKRSRCRREHRRAPVDEADGVLVGDHHALRHAGRARRIQDVREVGDPPTRRRGAAASKALSNDASGTSGMVGMGDPATITANSSIAVSALCASGMTPRQPLSTMSARIRQSVSMRRPRSAGAPLSTGTYRAPAFMMPNGIGGCADFSAVPRPRGRPASRRGHGNAASASVCDFRSAYSQGVAVGIDDG